MSRKFSQVKRNGKRAAGRRDSKGKGLEAGMLEEPGKARWQVSG